jgi:hypothetical protein
MFTPEVVFPALHISDTRSNPSRVRPLHDLHEGWHYPALKALIFATDKHLLNGVDVRLIGIDGVY